jgi:hypothetical protein
VGEFSGEYAGSGPYPGETLQLLSYMGGVRYQLPHSRFGGARALQPFGQVLVGGGHASGALAGAGEGTNAFVARVGEDSICLSKAGSRCVCRRTTT